MESVINSNVINDELLSEFFGGEDSNVTLEYNKYFIIEKKNRSHRKADSKAKNKGKANKLEWFESLDIQQRVEAVSTIATNNPELMYIIKNDLDKIENKLRNIDVDDDQITSNEDYLLSQSKSSLTSHYIPNSYAVSFGAELSPRFKDIISNVTFLDFKESEDTVSVMESLVEDATKFFRILDQTWSELRKNYDDSLKEVPLSTR